MKPETAADPTSVNIDSQNRHVAQRAGLDQDLGSAAVTMLGVILVLLFATVVWILI